MKYAGRKDLGVWWVRALGLILILRAPWDKPLFSERYGYLKYLRCGGWRLGLHKFRSMK